jgi:amino acid transporter
MLVPSRGLYMVGSISWALFFSFVTGTQLRSLLRQKRITGETLSMAISVYLLLAITWGTLFIAIYEFHPQAFSLGTFPSDASALPTREAFPVLFYFSLTTIATVGYGDVLPMSLQARYAAVAEAVVGQFYLAILVARLVALQVSAAAAGRADAERKENP